MIDTTCTGNLRPDTSVAIYQEHESGFLLPQLMGALASESALIRLQCNVWVLAMDQGSRC
ncbi:hypothetical protein [Pseudomonas brassicacearum]|uniref:hypothetical protein n=1 Tax=Pseudomonas brassicacearum TaxID=930166 RepID=UPI001BDF52DD|nr:hypothetical protein [Pseudomonas brassicacearum]